MNQIHKNKLKTNYHIFYRFLDQIYKHFYKYLFLHKYEILLFIHNFQDFHYLISYLSKSNYLKQILLLLLLYLNLLLRNNDCLINKLVFNSFLMNNAILFYLFCNNYKNNLLVEIYLVFSNHSI